MKHFIYVNKYGRATWNSKSAKRLIEDPKPIEQGKPGSTGVRVMMEGDFGWEVIEEPSGEIVVACFKGDQRRFSVPLYIVTLIEIHANSLHIRSGVEPHNLGFAPIKERSRA